MTQAEWISMAAVLLCLFVSAFFSAAETALTALSRARMYQLVMDGNRRAQLVSKLRKEKESLIGAVLLGNNLVNSAMAAVITALSIRVFGDDSEGLAIATLIAAGLIVIFAEILPKTYAIQNAERVSLAIAPVIYVIVRLLYPVTLTVQTFIRLLLKLFGIDITKANTLISATDVIRGTIELHHREGKMIKQDRDMLGSILDLNDIEVKHIMIHRKQMVTIDAAQPPDVIAREAIGSLHSRIPLWQDNPDNIIGVLHVKNLIKAMSDGDGRVNRETLLGLAVKPWFIPETTILRDQLIAFRQKRQHFAIVVDEYGAVQGIVTLEDIIEEIVGNIEDEHDETIRNVHKLGPDAVTAQGSVTIRDLNREMDWNLPDEHASTVAGLLTHEAQTIPTVGESFVLHGFRFTVEARDRTQVNRIRIEKLPETI